MEHMDITETGTSSSEHLPSKAFVFSAPSPPKTITSGFSSGHVQDVPVVKSNVFTFAMPTVMLQPCNQDVSNLQSNEKQYKPKILRNTFKPAVNVFAQALKDTAMFEQLKKNSRLQVTKINPENSITCTNVPQALLTKTTAKEYFTQFGNLLKITIRPKKQIITVTYATAEEANVAYNNGGTYLEEKFNIELIKSCNSAKSPTKKKDFQKHVVSNLLKSSEDEIKSELDAMVNLEYNLPNRNTCDAPLGKRSKTMQSKAALKPTGRAEKVSAKTDKHKSDSQISDLLPNATIEELQNIIQQPAQTSEDKYKVLEARDRLMRMKQVKLHTLAAAKVMIGTCPDMCPEKERLMRESKRQVALYELLDTNEYRINHLTAVKQYSRSSADQEEPMSHDLRPVKSLKMTMSYLLHEIANLCDQQGTNIGEWYHFLWDRTRGIRKDITQQELCCVDSVELVEQCARFHIVCSERLCAEEPSVFDKKINSDNLTKCLQSLKYMYHDLRVKGINCKNEPEFRAYIILLNLSNGNFMWDLQRLPTNIQKSAEVRFALEVYAALESNNYYKFFKLVQATTYLNACILLRYFNQVRIKALSVLVKAYCRTATTAYPLYELIDTLGFEDENEAIYLCEQVGLNVSKDALHVLLNRHGFAMPVLNIKQNRACNLIESKRVAQHLSIGECIAGGKMPEKVYEHHEPHSSFDPHGYLKPNSIHAEDQSKTDFPSPDPYEFVDSHEENSEASVVTPEKVKHDIDVNISENDGILKPTSTMETNKHYFTTIQPSVKESPNSKSEIQANKSLVNTDTTAKTEGQNNMKTFAFSPVQSSHDAFPSCSKYNSTFATSKSSTIFSQSFTSSKNNSSPFASKNMGVFASSTQENIFMKNGSSTMVFSKAHSNLESTSPAILVANTKDALNSRPNAFGQSTEVKGQVAEKKTGKNLKSKDQESHEKKEQINDIAEDIFDAMQTEVMHTYCSTIAKEEMDKIRVSNMICEDISKEIIDEVTSEMCDIVMKEEIDNMQKLHEMLKKIKNRVLVKYFNIWRSNVFRRRQQRIALDSTPVWLQKHSTEQYAKLLYSETQDVVIKNMRKKQDVEKEVKSYLKTLAPIEVIVYIGIKDNLRSSQANVCSAYYWKLIISWPNLHNKAVLWHHKKIMSQYLCPEDYTMDPVIKLYQPNHIETLHISIRHFEGLPRDHNLIGSDALLFIADASEDIKFMIKRLTKTVLSRDKLMPIPVVFISLGNSNSQVQDEATSVLEELLKSGYLSVYTIMHAKDLTEQTILNLTQSAILWLSINKSPQNPLEMDYLEDIYNTCLTEELWLRIFDDSAYNEKLLHALEEPNFIIDLHNEAVTHLMDIMLDPESFMYTKFAPEFKKFTKDQCMMPGSYEFFDDAWRTVDYKAKLEDVMSSFKLPRWRYKWPIDNSSVLRQCIISYGQEALISSENDDISTNILSSLFFTSGISTVSNFVDILMYINKRKACLIDTDLKVIYNKHHLKNFRTLPWWLMSTLLTEYNIVPKKVTIQKHEKENGGRKYDTNEPVTKKQKLYPFIESDSQMEPLATYCENSRSQVMEVNCISKKVEHHLKEYQQKNLLFEEKLRNALFSDSEYS